MLITEAGYLGVADFPHLLPLLAPGTSAGDSPAGVTVRRAASRADVLPPGRRIGLLALTAAHLGFRSLQGQLTAEGTAPFQVRWAHSLGSPHLELVAGPGAVSALALGRVGGRDVLATGDGDGTLRVWHVVGGRKAWAASGAHNGWISTVAVGRVAERDVIISGGGDDGTVRIWDGASGQPVGHALAAHGTWVGAVAVGRVAERDVIISGGGDDGTVRIWDGASGQLVGDVLAGSEQTKVSAVTACTIAGAGHVVAASRSGVVRIWRQGSDGRFADPPETQTKSSKIPYPESVALASRNGRCMVVCGSRSGTVEVRDAITGKKICPIPTHYDGIKEVTAGHMAGRDVVVTADDGGALRAWDTGTGQSVGDTLTGHTSQVTAVAVGAAGGRDVIASGDLHGSVRLWEPHTTLVRDPLKGHTEQVNAVAVGRVRDKEVIVSGGADSMMLTSKASSGAPASAPVGAHIFGITTVAVGKLRGKDVIVSGGRDGEIRVWDLATRRSIGEPTHPNWYHGSLVRIDQVALAEDVLASVNELGAISTWKATKGLLVGRSLRGDDQDRYWVTLAAGRLNGQSVIVTSKNDGSVRIWKASDRRPVGKAFKASDGGPVALTVGRVGGHDVIVTGSQEGEVRIWDASKRRQIGTAFTGHTGQVTSVTTCRMGQRELIVSCGEDCTVRVWQPKVQHSVAIVDLLAQPVSVACGQTGIIAVAVGTAVCVFASRPYMS